MNKPQTKLITKSNDSEAESKNRKAFEALFESSPIPTREKLRNFGVYLNRRNLMKVLLINDLYQKIVDVQGVVMEFGVRWGQNLALCENLRGIHEPYNNSRRIIGFDTFEGFPNVHEEDGDSDIIQVGAFNTTKGYEKHLEQVLTYHETENPAPHIKKYTLVKGDASKTVHKYLEENKEVVVAMAIFDFDLYEPTVECLEAIKSRLTKGSVLMFDELNHPDFPGETRAVQKVFGLDKYRIQRSHYSGYQSFLVIE